MAPLLFIRNEGAIKAEPGALLNVWIYFNLIVNTILLPALVLTFLFSRRVKRHSTLVNLCITWSFSGFFSVLLFYAGQHVGPEPSKPLCVAQSSLLYGITPMWSVAVLMLLYYVLLCVRGKQGTLGFYKLVFMLASPYVVQITFSLAALIISINNPELVTRAHRVLYCALDFPRLSWGMSSFTFIVCLAIVIVEAHLIIYAYRNWRGLRSAGRSGGIIDVQLFARVLTFGLYIMFGMVVNLISMFRPHSDLPDIYAATAGTAVFLVFGTQWDVLCVWCPWLRQPQAPPTGKRPILAIIIPKGSMFTSRRHSEIDLLKSIPPEKVAEAFKDLPPMPPPKSKEYLDSLGLKLGSDSRLEIRAPPPSYKRWQ